VVPGSSPAIDLGEYFTVTYLSILEKGGANFEIQGFRQIDISMQLTSEATSYPDGTIGEKQIYTGQLSNGATLRYVLWYILEDTEVSFANVSIPLKKNQLKQSIEIEQWPFRAPTYRLEISLQFGASKPIIRSGFGKLYIYILKEGERRQGESRVEE